MVPTGIGGAKRYEGPVDSQYCLERQLTAKDVELNAWRTAFGTQELSHAIAELELLRAVKAALDRSAYDICPCGECGKAVVCLPEGLPPICVQCHEANRDTDMATQLTQLCGDLAAGSARIADERREAALARGETIEETP